MSWNNGLKLVNGFFVKDYQIKRDFKNRKKMLETFRKGKK